HRPGDAGRQDVRAAGTGLTAIDPAITAIESQSYGGIVGIFTDADGNTNPAAYTATVQWPDGGVSSSTWVTYDSVHHCFDVNAMHGCGEEGAYTVTSVVHDQDGATVTITCPAFVTDASLSGAGNPMMPPLTQGVPFSGAVGTVTDQDARGLATDMTGTINWGDGTSGPATFTQTGGPGSTITVNGSHTYTQSGNFTLTATVANAGST